MRNVHFSRHTLSRKPNDKIALNATFVYIYIGMMTPPNLEFTEDCHTETPEMSSDTVMDV